MNYELAYAIGFHPWEDALEEPAFVETFSDLLDREEDGRTHPFGKALDLGTGSGIWAVELAKRGWEVTGVDIVERALRRARGRVRHVADRPGLDIRLVRGDVRDLRSAGIGSGYRLLLDTGTFHGLGASDRLAMAREVDAVAAEDATLLLLAWEPRRRGLLPAGASRAEIERTFPGWTITNVERSHFRAPPPVELLMKPDEHWYRLRRQRGASWT